MSLLPDVPPPPLGVRWSDWGENLNRYLMRIRDKLTFKSADSVPSQDGVLLWDRDTQQVVVSHNGEWQGLGHNDYGSFYTTTTLTAAATNTAYPITWSDVVAEYHITRDDTNTSRIYFDHAATFQIEFSAELQSGSGSSKTIYIFPRINGTDIPYSTIVHSVKNSGESQTISRSGIFTVEAGDYLEAMYAVTHTSLKIQGSAATAFSPAAPSATLMVTEVKV
jgi:hypothetical protein